MKHDRVALVRNSREGKERLPIAVKIRLGSTIYSSYRRTDSGNSVHRTHHICDCSSRAESDLHREVKIFFNLESLGTSKLENNSLFSEDERVQALLRSLYMVEFF